MLIDWFTVAAQALNFVILVWLMKRFLYKPVLHAIDTREKLIAAELADAAANKADAHKERDELAHKTEDLDHQRAAILQKATDDANAERTRLFAEARTAADALTTKRQDTLRTDAKNLQHSVQRRTQQEVFAIARKALTDLATASLEERMVAVLTRRLRELDGPTKAGLAAALKAASDAATVRSAFELPSDQRSVIQNALNETFAANVHIQFETAPELVSGIELATNGQKLAWTIADYLKSVQDGVDDLLKTKVEADAKAEAPKPAPAKAEPKPDPKPAAKPPEPEATAKPETKPAPKVEAPRSEAKSP
jgi:F-type H+-transporting ATPase subunit b